MTRQPRYRTQLTLDTRAVDLALAIARTAGDDATIAALVSERDAIARGTFVRRQVRRQP